jgi:hypothetical protein
VLNGGRFPLPSETSKTSVGHEVPRMRSRASEILPDAEEAPRERSWRTTQLPAARGPRPGVGTGGQRNLAREKCHEGRLVESQPAAPFERGVRYLHYSDNLVEREMGRRP